MVEAVAVGMLIGGASVESLVTLREYDPDVIEVVWSGEIGMEQMAYLERLSELVRASRRRRSLLYDLRAMTRYAHPVVGTHAGFSNEHRSQLEKIAVVSNLTSVRFAIRTVSLWQRVPIQGFASRRLALAWLRA